MYRVVLFFETNKGERIHYADIRIQFRKKYVFFGKYYANLEINLTDLSPEPMLKEDAEFTARLACLAFRNNGLLRVELEEVKE